MHKSLIKACEELDVLSNAVMAASSDNRALIEVFGWNATAVTRQDLADIPKKLAARIRLADPEQLDADLQEFVEDIPRRLQLLQQHQTVTHLFNGNSSQAVPAYMTFMQMIEHRLESILSWQLLQDNKAMPAQLARRLRNLQMGVDQITPDKEKLEAQIRLIQDATVAAESLPADLHTLSEAQKRIDHIASRSSQLFGQIDALTNDATLWTEYIRERKEAADKLVDQCEDAYRITTTKGLAASFDQRASRLAVSMWAWVVGLLGALAIGAWLGIDRVKILSSSIAVTSPEWGVIFMNIVLSVLSVGAPLWFAWLATKQIGQRFTLTEDYAFKASVAKAYEGYRKEAARLDEAFEARLFSSALSRFEEAPLRLVDAKNYGSPWQELISSDAFKDALRSVPGLRDKFLEIAKPRKPEAPKSSPREISEGEDKTHDYIK